MTNYIINLTQHAASDEQLEEGVVNLTMADQAKLKELLTFGELPTRAGISARAWAIMRLARECRRMMEDLDEAPARGDGVEVMIGGAPYLLPKLVQVLTGFGFQPVAAFSERVSEEDPETGRKVSIFKHLGFVEM